MRVHRVPLLVRWLAYGILGPPMLGCLAGVIWLASCALAPRPGTDCAGSTLETVGMVAGSLVGAGMLGTCLANVGRMRLELGTTEFSQTDLFQTKRYTVADFKSFKYLGMRGVCVLLDHEGIPAFRFSNIFERSREIEEWVRARYPEAESVPPVITWRC